VIGTETAGLGGLVDDGSAAGLLERFDDGLLVQRGHRPEVDHLGVDPLAREVLRGLERRTGHRTPGVD